MNQTVKQVADNLYDLVHEDGFKGYDPFDGLNSRMFQSIGPVYRNRLLRLVWIQFFKRFPINLRRILLIDKGYNPKALALFVLGLLYRYRLYEDRQSLAEADRLIDRILTLRAGQTPDRQWAWGYNFDWQARAFFVPRGTPNIIVTAFVVFALYQFSRLTAFDATPIIVGAADALLEGHLIDHSDDEACLSYIPNDTARVHNANLWGAVVLALAFTCTGNPRFKEQSLRCANYSCRRQRSDGAWLYGERRHHRFVDGFHTGYNLEALSLLDDLLGERRFEPVIRAGMNFYTKHCFLSDGTPKYYEACTYPLDIHSCAQALITLLRVKEIPCYRRLASRVMRWTLANMRSRRGTFYYQRTRWYVNRIPYIRWGQAWMFYALNYYLFKTDPSAECPTKTESISWDAPSTH